MRSGSLFRDDPLRACEAGPQRTGIDHIGFQQSSRHATDWAEPVYNENGLWHAVDALIVGNIHIPSRKSDQIGRAVP